MNKTWSIVLWLIGEAVLVAGFVLFGLNDLQSHLILNLIVSSIILTVFLMSIFRDTKVLVKRGVGNGMKWFFTLNYTTLSIGAMVYFGFFNSVDILTQVIVQLIFFAVLVLGMWGAFKPAKKAEVNNKYLKMEQDQLIMIRNVIGVSKLRADKRVDLPANLRLEITTLQEEANQIEPGNEIFALKMEGRIMLEMNEILTNLKEQVLDLKKLQYALKRCFKLIAEYKETYSRVEYKRS